MTSPSPSSPPPTSLLTLQQTHVLQRQALQSRLTQKKRTATKKTRKGINDECASLEARLATDQQLEISTLLHALSLEAPLPTTTDPSPSHPQPQLTEQHHDDHAPKIQTHPQPTADPLSHETAPPPAAGRARLQAHAPGETRSQDAPHQAPPQPAPESDSKLTSQPPEQVPNLTQPVTHQPQQQPRKPNRQKARLARKAAATAEAQSLADEEAAALPDARAVEQAVIRRVCDERGLVEHQIRPDGHCLYSAVADQLLALGLWKLGDPIVHTTSTAAGSEKAEPYIQMRHVAASTLEAHREDFEPFLDEPFEGHVRNVRGTAEWGGQTELLALARAFGVVVCVVMGDGRVERVVPPEGGEGVTKGEGGMKEIWVAFLRHGYGLGEHYNSLRRKG